MEEEEEEEEEELAYVEREKENDSRFSVEKHRSKTCMDKHVSLLARREPT